MNFADGQRRTRRLQIFCLPSANETFAIGKCLADRRQNSYRINGKLLVCHRQIFSLPPANFLFAIGKFSVCHTASNLRLCACGLPRSGKLQYRRRRRRPGRENTVQRIIKKNKSPHPQADKKQAVRANTETPRRDPQRKSAACSTQNQNRNDSKENNPMCKPQRRKQSHVQTAAAIIQCWKRGRGLGRERNNASEAEGSLPPRKNTVQRTTKRNKSPHPQADKKQAVRANTETPRKDTQRK